ncbi:MAG: phosphoribosylformylglycinamidine cyclo-ligase [Candidatus Melainabacteria bacterium]|nr:phosphoribosylformylglycinamidine cyclo-ligase [Candidatus Melainabacteria bacterium]
MMSSKLTYKDSGVDIEAGNKTVEYIKPLAKKTYRSEVISGIGGFNGLFKLPTGYKDPVLVACTDGVGTKLKLAFKLNDHETIGIDLVAMCVNDLICSGAEPLFFLDYFATGKLSPDQAKEVIKGIADGCLQSNCTLLGGETAELPGFYKNGEYDLAGFAVGIVERSKIIDGSKIKAGDSLIGIQSSGLHSNGYSLAQKVLFEVAKWDVSFKHKDLDKPIGKLLLAPTFIYTKLIQNIREKFEIKGIVNITGGGLTENTPRIFPNNIGCEFDLTSWKKPKIFKIIQELGNIERDEMLRTFNNGIGMILVTDKQYEQSTINEIQKLNYKSYKIGTIVESKKDKEKVFYKGEF